MTKRKSMRCSLVATAVVAMIPAFVFAAETDRLTVEDPVTSAVKFRLTSEGNVSGGIFTGDGSGLTNVAHFKGAWSGVTAYAKDDCVSYNGSSYIALGASTNAQPDVTPASWAVMAAKGLQGDKGDKGDQGNPGIQGVQGIQGPAGSPDTQSQILTKIGAQADGAVLTVQQGLGEGASASKIVVKDSSGSTKFSVQSNGAVGIGTSTATYPVTIDSGIATAVPAGVGMVMLSGTTNKERIEIRSFGAVTDSAPTIQGKAAVMVSGVPNTRQNQILFNFGGGGYDNTGNMIINNMAVFQMKAEEAWTPTAQGTYMSFQTTASGTVTKSEKMRLTGAGNVGIGATAPTQKLEVNGGVRINTAAAKPTCDSTTRGTFWLTQNGTGSQDVFEVCIKNATDAYIWKAVW